jgi:hypothetical protein
LEVACVYWEKFYFGSSYWLGFVNFSFRHLAGSQKLPLRIVFCKLRAEAIISCVFVVEHEVRFGREPLQGVQM